LMAMSIGLSFDVDSFWAIDCTPCALSRHRAGAA
jgi:hypothetical protein